MLPNNSLASDTPTVHDPTLAVPLQHFNVGNTVPIETILQSTVTTTLVNQEIEIIDIKQEDAQRTPTTNAIEQQMLESLVHSEHEKNFNEVNNDKVQDDTMFLTIKQAWDLYQFLSVDQVQLFAQTLSQSQKEFFRLYKEQASLESVADDMVTDDVANEANDNTGASVLTADYNATQLSNEQYEFVSDIKKLYPDVYLNAHKFVLGDNALVYQPKTMTLAELLSNESFANNEGCNSDVRMNLVLQWIRIASALEKVDLWSRWRTMYVEDNTVTGNFTLQLDILDVHEPTDVINDFRNKNELVAQCKMVLNIKNQEIPEQSFAFSKILENLDHSMLEHIFNHSKVLVFFATYRECFATLSANEQLMLESDLTAAINNKRFHWISKGSSCYRFCQGMQVRLDQFDNKKASDMGLFLGQILQWRSDERFTGVVNSICSTHAATAATLYRRVRDEVEPLVFVHFYRTLKKYIKFEECFNKNE